MRESKAYDLDKEYIATLRPEGREDVEKYIIDVITKDLAERVMTILSTEGEIVLMESDVRVYEDMPTNSVRYRRDITWNHLVRCKDCKHYEWADNRAFGMRTKYCSWTGFEDVDDNDFCSRSERREDG